MLVSFVPPPDETWKFDDHKYTPEQRRRKSDISLRSIEFPNINTLCL